MPRGIEPVDALDLLVREKREAKRFRTRQQELAGYATDVLRSRGELVFTKKSMYDGTPGLIGSAHLGLSLTQATRPVAVRDSFIALRDGESDKSKAIELVRSAIAKPAHVREVTDIIAVMEQGKLYVPGVLQIEDSHRLAVNSLVKVIEDTIDPLEKPQDSLPKVIYNGRGEDSIINIRENPDALAELDPVFRSYAKRVSTNFSS